MASNTYRHTPYHSTNQQEVSQAVVVPVRSELVVAILLAILITVSAYTIQQTKATPCNVPLIVQPAEQ